MNKLLEYFKAFDFRIYAKGEKIVFEEKVEKYLATKPQIHLVFSPIVTCEDAKLREKIYWILPASIDGIPCSIFNRAKLTWDLAGYTKNTDKPVFHAYFSHSPSDAVDMTLKLLKRAKLEICQTLEIEDATCFQLCAKIYDADTGEDADDDIHLP